MRTAEQAIREVIDDISQAIDTDSEGIARALNRAERDLIELFRWHPIADADRFGLRIIPPGKPYGPRVVTWVKGDNQKAPVPFISYWARTYWHTLNMTTGWSQRNQPTHFLRPYLPE